MRVGPSKKKKKKKTESNSTKGLKAQKEKTPETRGEGGKTFHEGATRKQADKFEAKKR